MHLLYDTFCKKIRWYYIAALYILQMAIFQVMMRVIFPVVEKNLGDYHVLDMVKQGYNSEYVAKLLSLMDEASKNMYLHVQMPLDFLYPVIMAGVFFLIFAKTWRKPWYVCCVLPLLLIIFDWTENVCILLLFSDNLISERIVKISSFCTQAKSIVGDYVLYYLAILSIGVSVMRFVIRRYKRS